MSISDAPNYIHTGNGVPVFRGPYMQADSKIAAFLLRSDIDQLQAVCDKYLNAVIDDGSIRYRALVPFTIATYSDMKTYSLDKRDRQVGWLPEIDLSFWVLTVAMKKVGKFYVPSHLAWFMPYLFVSNQYAKATGREVYGFRKELGDFQTPPDIKEPAFTASTLAFNPFGPETEGTEQWLMSTQKAEDNEGATEDWTGMEDVRQAILPKLAENALGHVAADFLDEIINLFVHTHNVQQRVVFLKQYPAVDNTDKAAYQAVVEAPATLNAFHGGGLIWDGYDVVLNHLDSHPIAQELGWDMEDGRQRASASWWMNVDFTMEFGEEVYRAKPQKKKIAVLGGGMGSMTAVYGLTSQPGWQDLYDITVYQLGWRLGGKGASGRQAKNGQRIEEHGLHIWFGFYDNSFKLIKDVYESLARASDAPLATWDKAFRPHDFYVLEEYHNDKWKNWPIWFPPNNKIPGDGGRELDIWQSIEYILSHLQEYFKNSEAIQAAVPHADRASVGSRVLNWLDDALEKVGLDLIPDEDEPITQKVVVSVLDEALALMHKMDPEETHAEHPLVQDLIKLLEGFLKIIARIIEAIVDWNDTLRRDLLLLELAAVNVIGILADGVLWNGFSVINDKDYREWLLGHGASDHVAYSAPVRMMYDLAFAYPQGKTGPDEPTRAGNFAAGSTLHSAMLIALAYKGSAVWKMQAGMGDVVFAPIYQALKAKGVKFEFFTKITDLIPDAETGTISEIKYDQQVTLKNGDYNPLMTVKGLPCWPSEPLYDQIEEGEKLQAEHINLESYWTPWEPVECGLSLEKGKDFDEVVLGISIGALPYICSKLMDETYNPNNWQAWKDMTSNVQTVQTQAMQVWLDRPLGQTGWQLANPLTGSYVQPFSTWADMDQTSPHENWPNNHNPRNVAYMCGPLPDASVIPPFSDHEFPVEQKAQVKKTAIAWLKANMPHLWPNMFNNDGEFEWGALVDTQNRSGEARFDGQYWRANIDPTERYVLSVANTEQYRMKTDENGFSNLYLAGDWIDNNWLNAGAIEPTVVSGLQASRAICGYPQKIVGEGGF